MSAGRPLALRTSSGLRCSIDDLGAGRSVRVDRRSRSGDVERNVVVAGEDRERVGADLVGDVAVGGDPIAARDHRVDPARGQRRRRGCVGDDRDRDPGLGELPRGQAAALEQRPRLARQNADRLAGAGLRVDDPERGADAGRGEPARVADGEDALGAHQQRTPVLADALARLGVLARELVGRGEHALANLRRRARVASRLDDTVDRGVQVHGRRPRGGERPGGILERLVRRVVAELVDDQHDRVRGTDPDRRRAADGEPPDRVDHLGRRAQGQNALFARQQRLVEDRDAAVAPGHRRGLEARRSGR